MKPAKIELPLLEKAVLTPREFAALFGRQHIWAYRQVYAGKVKVLTEFGHMMIPSSEVRRVLDGQHVYDGRKTGRNPSK